MEISIKPTIAQVQILAPQLQQSLTLLQAPMLELKALVEQEMQQNPVLEEMTSEEVDSREDGSVSKDGETTPSTLDSSDSSDDDNFDSNSDKANGEPVDVFEKEFKELAELDQAWKDVFDRPNIPIRKSPEEEEKWNHRMESIVMGISLQESLMEQVRLSEIPEDQWPIAEVIVGNIDDYGYLKSNVEELAFATSKRPEELQEVLEIVQTFHPAGVGARDLRECIMIQLERQGRQDSLEYKIVRDQMDALSKRRLPEISRALGHHIEEVQNATNRIANLEPRPGRAFLPDNDQYIMPEVFVDKVGEDYVVTTNNEQVPHLRISNTYKDLMSQNNSGQEVKSYIQEKIRAGKFLIKSIHQRQETILNIAREIVKRQREFMDNGVAYLKPLTMVQVAEVVSVHETTVSRAVSGKYIQTPQGVFEMKYFFTSGIQTADGAGMSNTSVKDMISDIFDREDPTKPLSDQEVVEMLKDKGINIARRTVAKYRSELNILPSNLRKSYMAS